MAVSRDCDCSPPSNTWDSFTLAGHSDGATNTRPPQEGKRGEKEKEENEWVGGICHHTIPASQRTQRMAHNGSSFVLW